MPSAKTYQAVGFVTWQGGKAYIRAKRPEIERDVGVVALGALLVSLLVAVGIKKRPRRSTV